MKFIHTADIHWNAVPDSTKPWSESRRHAIRHTFQALISHIEEEQIPLLLISGDLFHTQPILKDLTEVNALFESIFRTKVVIISGEHDYLKDSSHYHSFQWAENVSFLSSEEVTSVYFPELNVEVHGFSYHKPEIHEPVLDTMRAPRDVPGRERLHILMAHGGDAKHIPFKLQTLKNSGFDYIALGHVHKPGILIDNLAAYPGSLEPLSRKEYGVHGYILGEWDSGGLSIKHVPFSKIQYISLVIHITPETLNLELESFIKKEIDRRGAQNIYRFKLTGLRNPDLKFDFQSLEKLYKIVEISDRTEPAYDYDKLYLEHKNDMIGLFIAAFQKPELSRQDKKALYYGLKALMLTTDEGKA